MVHRHGRGWGVTNAVFGIPNTVGSSDDAPGGDGTGDGDRTRARMRRSAGLHDRMLPCAIVAPVASHSGNSPRARAARVIDLVITIADMVDMGSMGVAEPVQYLRTYKALKYVCIYIYTVCVSIRYLRVDPKLQYLKLGT